MKILFSFLPLSANEEVEDDEDDIVGADWLDGTMQLKSGFGIWKMQRRRGPRIGRGSLAQPAPFGARKKLRSAILCASAFSKLTLSAYCIVPPWTNSLLETVRTTEIRSRLRKAPKAAE